METPWQTYQKELADPQTTAQRRIQIGKILANPNDPRPGVGVKAGLPEIAWLPVASGGEVEVKRLWRPESPGEAAKITRVYKFTVEPFYIAKYLVTNAQYGAFVDAKDGFAHSLWWQGMPEVGQGQTRQESRPQRSNYPRAGLSWYQSVSFARWLNHCLQGFSLPLPSSTGLLRVGENAQIRLPTEWECGHVLSWLDDRN